MNFKIGDRVFVRGYIDEIRKDTVIVRNDGGYFGTIPSEVITGELPSSQPEITRCKDCVYYDPTDNDDEESDWCHAWGDTTEGNAFCSYAERKGEQP